MLDSGSPRRTMVLRSQPAYISLTRVANTPAQTKITKAQKGGAAEDPSRRRLAMPS